MNPVWLGLDRQIDTHMNDSDLHIANFKCDLYYLVTGWPYCMVGGGIWNRWHFEIQYDNKLGLTMFETHRTLHGGTRNSKWPESARNLFKHPPRGRTKNDWAPRHQLWSVWSCEATRQLHFAFLLVDRLVKWKNRLCCLASWESSGAGSNHSAHDSVSTSSFLMPLVMVRSITRQDLLFSIYSTCSSFMVRLCSLKNNAFTSQQSSCFLLKWQCAASTFGLYKKRKQEQNRLILSLW